MKFASVLVSAALLCAQGAMAGVDVLRPDHKSVRPESKFWGATSSTAQPRHVPESLKTYQQLAVMAQGSNCIDSKVNETLGDATLLYQWGDDDKNQRMHVYHSKSMGITFSWAGMNTSSISSLLSSADLFLVDADPEIFGFLAPGTKVYQGFQAAYKRVAPIVEKKVKEYTHKYNDTRVSFTGLSFGAALSTFGALHMNHVMKDAKLHKVVVMGLPRIGNPTWANEVDKYLKGTFYYTVNGDDLVSRVPPRELGYQQPSGQIYINPANSSSWKFYPGQENVHGSDSQWGFSIQDHTGVYYNVPVGGVFGPCPPQVPKALENN